MLSSINPSIKIALCITALACLWLVNGTIHSFAKPEYAESDIAVNQDLNTTPAVSVKNSQAQNFQPTLRVTGIAETPSRVVLKSEINGRVEEILVSEGEAVTKGAELVRIALDDRQALLEEAKRDVQEKQIALEAEQSLAKRDLSSQGRVAQARAALQQAQAKLETAQIRIDNTIVKAPYDGIFNRRDVEVGDLVMTGTEIGEFVALGQIEVIAYISEKDISRVKIGQEVDLIPMYGRNKQKGIIAHVSQATHPQTRTYRIKIVLQKADKPALDDNHQSNPFKIGQTIITSLKLDPQKGHYITPAILTLNDAGIVGIRSVDHNNKVQFHPVTIAQTDPDGTWITGTYTEKLPQKLKIIIVGQEFVAAGEAVDISLRADKSKL